MSPPPAAMTPGRWRRVKAALAEALELIVRRWSGPCLRVRPYVSGAIISTGIRAGLSRQFVEAALERIGFDQTPDVGLAPFLSLN